MALNIPTAQPVQTATPNYQNQQFQSPNPIFAWSNGKDEAERYPIPANSWALLMDRNEDIFYIRRRDAYGNAYPIEIYDFTKRVVADPNAPVGREEFDKLTAMVAKLVDELGVNKEGEG